MKRIKKKPQLPAIVLSILALLSAIILTSFVYRILFKTEYYDLNADFQPYYEYYTNDITAYRYWGESEINEQGKTTFSSDHKYLTAEYTLTTEQILGFLKTGTGVNISLIDPNGKPFKTPIEYYILLGAIVEAEHATHAPHFNDYYGLTLEDFPDIDPNTLHNYLFKFKTTFIVRDSPEIFDDDQFYTTITLTQEHMEHVFSNNPFSMKTRNGETLYYIGSYSRSADPSKHRDLYLSATDVNEYFSIISAREIDREIIQLNSPDSELEWHALNLKMPYEQLKSYIFLIFTPIILIFCLAHNEKFMTWFLDYMHLNDDE